MKSESVYPSYPEYKDSGIEWLGEVPGHWKIQKLKSLCKFTGGGTPSKDNLDYWRGSIPWVSPKDMKSEWIIATEDCISDEGLKSSTSSMIPMGSLLMVVRSGILKHTIPIAIAAVPLSLNQDMKALLFDDKLCVSMFILRWVQGLNDALLFIWTKQGATVESIEHEYLANTTIPVPPVGEQLEIVNFLDQETSKIDTLIEKQQLLIALLIEKRQAVISHALTKGLDLKVPMKDSGIRWVGRVPGHWELLSLGAVTTTFQTGPFGSQLHSSEYVENETPVINPSNIKDGRIVPDWSNTVTEEVVGRLNQHIMRAGDLVVGRRGELGRCAVVRYEEAGWMCGTGCIRIMLKPNCLPEYVSMLFMTSGLREALSQESVGATMDNLNTAILARLKFATPPLHEQQAIVAFIDLEASKIDALIEKAKQSVELLKERRSALISAAVTGKIDVRQVG